MKNPLYIEASGVRLRRSICGRCCLPCVWLGEAIRVDLAEGGFEILHVCLPCVRRSRLSVAAGGRVRYGREVQAA
jgi:RNase P subunit RPR2